MPKRRRRRRRNSFGEIEHQDASMRPDAREWHTGWSAPSYVSVPNPDHDPDDPHSPKVILVPTDSVGRGR